MFTGKLYKIKFEFYGVNTDIILDRLPTAKIIEQNEKGYLIEAEVYSKGIIMWILSQGSKVKLLEPYSLVNEIKEEIARINSFYNQKEN